MLRVITLWALLLCNLSLYAETCPTIQDIKAQKLNGWKLYDLDDGKALSANREAFFKANIDKFVLAEWVDEKNHTGTIHCYYHDKNGSSLEAYLSKSNFVPKNKNKFWYEVTGSLRCAADPNSCEFTPGEKLAKSTFAQN